MTLERSHGKPRATRPRLRDVAAVAPDADRRRRNHDHRGRFAAGNAAGAGQGAKRVLEAPEVGLEAGLASASCTPSEAATRAQLVQSVRALYRAARKDLGCDSPVCLSSTATYARETVLAGYLIAAAVEAGLTTDRGLQLLEAAQRSEGRAERASIHALTLAAKLAEATLRQRGARNPLHARILDATPDPEPEPEPKGAA